jgi:hypothetical protein
LLRRQPRREDAPIFNRSPSSSSHDIALTDMKGGSLNPNDLELFEAIRNRRRVPLEAQKERVGARGPMLGDLKGWTGAA